MAIKKYFVDAQDIWVRDLFEDFYFVDQIFKPILGLIHMLPVYYLDGADEIELLVNGISYLTESALANNQAKTILLIYVINSSERAG